LRSERWIIISLTGTAPFGISAGSTFFSVVVKACGNRFSIRIFLVLDDDPFACCRCSNRKAGLAFSDVDFYRRLACSRGCGEGLSVDFDGFHIFIEQGDMKLSILLSHLSVHGFVGAEFEDAAFVGTEFDFSVTEGEACGEGEDYCC
jgi:hypothetical protein